MNALKNNSFEPRLTETDLSCSFLVDMFEIRIDVSVVEVDVGDILDQVRVSTEKKNKKPTKWWGSQN